MDVVCRIGDLSRIRGLQTDREEEEEIWTESRVTTAETGRIFSLFLPYMMGC